MAYYHTCEHCGANLDPGEQCDCTEGENTMEDKVFDEKVNKYGDPMLKTFKEEIKGASEENVKDITSDFVAMLEAMRALYIFAAEDHTDLIGFTHILNRLAIQHLMDPKEGVNTQEEIRGSSNN